MNLIVKRFKPGQELKEEILKLFKDKKFKGGVVLSLVGSLREVSLRLENMETVRGALEIVSATGTISKDGIHVHLILVDHKGKLYAGHLKKGIILTTIELAFLETDVELARRPDRRTGYDELIVDGK